MKRVIDIPENWETKILNMSDSEIMDFLYAIVRNGIPLPTDAVDRVTIKEYMDSYNGVKTELEPCEDTISRQEVLEALDKSKYSNEFCEEHHIDWSINIGMAHIVVNELKPVTPQPKMGKWIVTYEKDEVYSNVCICSECSHSDIGSGNYCRWCGAKMLQEAEE